MEVYKAIATIQGELAKVGIAKTSENTQQNYKFRGIDAVYGALSPLLAKHGLCVLPRIVGLERSERVTIKEYNGQKKESVLFYVTVEAEFDFVAVADGSKHTVRTYGEAMDSGDKATNKAMSAAYKYAAFMTFAIPTEGDNDADSATHEVAPRREVGCESAKPRTQPKPLEGLYKTRAEVKTAYSECVREMHSCEDADTLDIFLMTQAEFHKQLQDELPHLWNGDGKEFLGMAKEIESARRSIELIQLGKAA